ncbi:20189_t:CDS:2 [Entrophospora sp. SA101]|nr:20189_t:CDS:2 [Entrophospora sp. SA101]
MELPNIGDSDYNMKKNNDLSGTLSSPPKEIDEDEDDEIEFEDSVIKFGSNYNE